tara:strand:- start:86 stop:787 length:702 start_codon:yes stop_codon:yes gene_type:complete
MAYDSFGQATQLVISDLKIYDSSGDIDLMDEDTDLIGDRFTLEWTCDTCTTDELTTLSTSYSNGERGDGVVPVMVTFYDEEYHYLYYSANLGVEDPTYTATVLDGSYAFNFTLQYSTTELNALLSAYQRYTIVGASENTTYSNAIDEIVSDLTKTALASVIKSGNRLNHKRFAESRRTLDDIYSFGTDVGTPHSATTGTPLTAEEIERMEGGTTNTTSTTTSAPTSTTSRGGY